MLIPDHETVVDFLNYAAIAGTAIELLNDNCAKSSADVPA